MGSRWPGQRPDHTPPSNSRGRKHSPYIQASKPLGSPAGSWPAPQIPRGDLQTTFTFKGFDEVRLWSARQGTFY